MNELKVTHLGLPADWAEVAKLFDGALTMSELCHGRELARVIRERDGLGREREALREDLEAERLAHQRIRDGLSALEQEMRHRGGSWTWREWSDAMHAILSPINGEQT